MSKYDVKNTMSICDVKNTMSKYDVKNTMSKYDIKILYNFSRYIEKFMIDK